ncbi:hypothetical protein DEU56DRAFT_471299 [Suillus clintonianus]|uniref:uncharacterized protein n=1 Tax=Suillus clintonianus TaxID=1904413 RepID=UPI001B8808F7|nr:uncharacterized protein DEU56DRAFT_471299 [Suillus clintonianus]KAG2153176.1 hypothetical protein DEU56DRAFT_471299 [Suillus clintonianus]
MTSSSVECDSPAGMSTGCDALVIWFLPDTDTELSALCVRYPTHFRSGYSIPAASPSSESLDLDLESNEMVQKYGAVLTTAADAIAGDSEHSALLGGNATPLVTQREGHGNIRSSVNNLSNVGPNIIAMYPSLLGSWLSSCSSYSRIHCKYWEIRQ